MNDLTTNATLGKSQLSIGAFATIFNANGEILCIRQNYGPRNWTTPGGKADPNESPDATVLREVQEEVGLRAKVLALSGVYWKQYANDVVFSFVCDAMSQDQIKHDPAEVAEYGYFPADALPVPMARNTRLRIEDAVRLKRGGGTSAFAVFATPETYITL